MQIPDTLLMVCWNEQQSVTGMLASTPWCFGGVFFPPFLFWGGGAVMWHSSKEYFVASEPLVLSWVTRQTDSGSGRSVSTCDCDNSTGLLKRKKSNGFWVIQPSKLLVQLRSLCCYLFCGCDHTWRIFNTGRSAICDQLVLSPLSQNFFPDQMVTWCQQPNGSQAQLLQVLSKTDFLLK